MLEAQARVLTNKYAEGYPGKRYYGGCEYVDEVERLAIDRAKQLFGAEHANVQPHSGAQANMAVYFALLCSRATRSWAWRSTTAATSPTASKLNFSGKLYKVVPYGVSTETETIDYDEVARLAHEHKPKLIVAGARAYPRTARLRALPRDRRRASARTLMVDMAHIAGLVAAGLHPNPVPHADFVTTTTHKTLRGPRGGFILCTEELAPKDRQSASSPALQGGPLMHVIAAKAVGFGGRRHRSSAPTSAQTSTNAQTLAAGLQDSGCRLVSAAPTTT